MNIVLRYVEKKKKKGDEQRNQTVYSICIAYKCSPLPAVS